MGGRIAKEFDLQKLILKRATITGSTMRARNSQEKHRLLNLYMNMCGRLLAQGKCLPQIYKTYAFSDVQSAHACMEQGDHIGKIVLEMNA